MTFEEFVDLVDKMREAQIDYFRTRDKDCLNRSKQYEKRVDNAVKALKSDKNKLL